MPDYFFDTTVLLAYFKNEDPRSVSLVKAVIQGQYVAAVSAITVAEVCANSEMNDSITRRERLALLALMQIVPLNSRLAEQGGTIKRNYKNKLPDALIAASCRHAGGYFFAKDHDFQRLLNTWIITGEIISS